MTTQSSLARIFPPKQHDNLRHKYRQPRTMAQLTDREPAIYKRGVLHNRLYNQHAKCAYHLPKYSNVIVLGAGPSLTEEMLELVNFDDYDAIIITIPMMKHFEEMLGNEDVYVVDAEVEYFTYKWFHSAITDKVALVCPISKMLPADANFRDLYFYEREDASRRLMGEDGQKFPRSGGAAALYTAIYFMEAEHVDALGFDLSVEYECFTPETLPLLELPQVTRWYTQKVK